VVGHDGADVAAGHADDQVSAGDRVIGEFDADVTGEVDAAFGEADDTVARHRTPARQQARRGGGDFVEALRLEQCLGDRGAALVGGAHEQDVHRLPFPSRSTVAIDPEARTVPSAPFTCSPVLP